MVVCHCRRVSHHTIEAAVSAGASSVSQVTGLCGAGGRCGSCVATIEALLDHLAEITETCVSAPAA